MVSHLEYLIKNLKEEFGKQNWWKSGIPEKVRKKCAIKKEADLADEPRDTFFELIDSYEIIWKNQILVNTFTPPGMEKEGKKNRLNWIVEWNGLRKRYSG